MAVRGAITQIEDTVICGCGLSAKVKVRTETGWENLCMGCYYKHHYQQSVDYCAALGLNTTEQRIAWLKKHAAGITKRYTQNVPAREPGVDYEEDFA
jgi:hypothetical protein